MKKRIYQKNRMQSGRSMVEMLGVLAIIGVLSIGGISGYRYAMNRHEANQIVNDITMTATIVSGFAMAKGGSRYLTTDGGAVIDVDTPYPAESDGDEMFIVKPPVSIYSSSAVCEMVLTNYTTPYQIMGMDGSSSREIETPLSESEIKGFCKKPIRFLWFRFFDDLG